MADEVKVIETTSLHNREWRTYQRSGIVLPNRIPEGNEVYHWPEFIAFAKRLGIPHEKLTTRITITLAVDELIRVSHDYKGEERHLPVPETGEGTDATD